MLIEGFLRFAFDVLIWLFALIPDVELPEWDLSPLASAMGALNEGLPITEALTAAAFFLVLLGALWLFGFVRWLKTHLPFVGGK